MNANTDKIGLAELVAMLRTFVCQRPGFEPGNYYGAPAAYRADVRTAGQHRADALAMLRTFENLVAYAGPCDSNAARDALLEELRHGRLRLVRTDDGRWALDYCTGQYWCTEFRAAVCRVLSGALWTLQRAECPHLDGDGLRRSFRNWYGPGIARRWFR